MDLRLETKVSELTEVTQFKCNFAHDVKRAIPRVKIGQRTNGKMAHIIMFTWTDTHTSWGIYTMEI
mgnify:CR=1 FL=1